VAETKLAQPSSDGFPEEAGAILRELIQIIKGG
jgi:hypothetical protein